MSAHTTGLVVVRVPQDSPGTYRVRDSRGFGVAHVFGRRGEGEALANANLFAAASELLDAARHFGACDLAGTSIEFRCEECVAARAAIAKAEGKS